MRAPVQAWARADVHTRAKSCIDVGASLAAAKGLTMRAFLAAAWLAVLATPAAAQEMTIYDLARTDALELVRDTCFAQSANASTIAADLAARGWRRISEEERRQRDPDDMGGGFIMHWATSQAWASPDDPSLTLVLGEGPLGQGAARANFCMVIEGAAFSQQVSSIRRWLGFQRFQRWGPGGDNFAYIRDADGSISDGARAAETDRIAALREGRLGFIQVVGDRTRSVVNFSAIQPPAERGTP